MVNRLRSHFVFVVLVHFRCRTVDSAFMEQGEQANTKSEPGALATGRILNLFKDFALLAFLLTGESLTGRYTLPVLI